MKKLLGVLLVVASFQSAMATSLMGTLLEFQRLNKKPSGNPVHTLSVYMDGRVVHRLTSPQLPGGMSFKQVTRLNQRHVERIERLINRSTPVVQQRVPVMAKCFAPSTTTDFYNAANNSIFLKKGAICDGGFTINARPAARKLTRVLEVLEHAAHANANLSEIDRQVESALDGE